MDATNPVAPRVHGFVPFPWKKDPGQKDVGQKHAAPQRAPSREFPLLSGEETTDLVTCGLAVVRTPSDATWDLKGATVYYKRAIINFCDGEGHLKPCDVKLPIAINSAARDGTIAPGAVVRCTTQPCGGGKAHIKERVPVQAPLNYTWNHSRWTSLSKLTTTGGQMVADHVGTLFENVPVMGTRSGASQVGEVAGQGHTEFKLGRTPPEEA